VAKSASYESVNTQRFIITSQRCASACSRTPVISCDKRDESDRPLYLYTFAKQVLHICQNSLSQRIKQVGRRTRKRE